MKIKGELESKYVTIIYNKESKIGKRRDEI
jgi:hypothetical protein